jgi:hypothetical protein
VFTLPIAPANDALAAPAAEKIAAWFTIPGDCKTVQLDGDGATVNCAKAPDEAEHPITKTTQAKIRELRLGERFDRSVPTTSMLTPPLNQNPIARSQNPNL